VPGPLDITANSILPRRPILSSFTGKLKQKLPKAHFMSNPCRIKCFGQEIVIFRDDIMARILRNTMGAKVDVQDDALKKYVSEASGDWSFTFKFTSPSAGANDY
jgi:DNA polymerase epsilon subunit 2